MKSELRRARLLMASSLLVISLSPAISSAQTVEGDRLLASVGDQPEEVVTVNTRLVSVTVQPTGRLRKAIEEQSPPALRIMADGFAHAPAFISAETSASVALVVDMSTSMRGRKAGRAAVAVKELLEQADPRNEYTLVIFNDSIKVLGKFRGDPEGRAALMAALVAQPAAGETILYDACLEARRLVERMTGPRGKRAIVVFTDGLDTRSKTPISALNAGLNSLGGLVYLVVLGSGVQDELPYVTTPNPLLDQMAAELASATGGEAFPARSFVKLSRAASRVADRLNNAVQVGFYPLAPAATAGTHRLEVYDDAGKRLRARPNYVID